MKSQPLIFPRRILAIVAHPDDETMLAGGTLALLAQAGAEVHYLCATRGEGGEMGEPPLSDRPGLGALRTAEMRCAVQALGGASLAFMDYTDPLVGADNQLHPYTSDWGTLLDKLQGTIQALQPQAIITHGSNGEYGHPAHRLTHRAVREVLRRPDAGTPGPLLYTFSASFLGHPKPRLANQDDQAHLVLDIRPVLEQKTAAAWCHRSQHALFVRRASLQAGRPLSVPEVLMTVESLHRVFPPLRRGQPRDALASLLAPWQQASHQPTLGQESA
ncbi:MAG: PIG-L family deacetylase [Anaerolineales bacterium]|nr:PIG-L family deacetylase [Anaerolineales bacterium]